MDGDQLTAEEMATLVAEVTLGVAAEESKLAPLTAEQLAFRKRVGREVRDATRAGRSIDIPPP